jgi:hypothetical protein
VSQAAAARERVEALKRQLRPDLDEDGTLDEVVKKAKFEERVRHRLATLNILTEQ